MNKILIPTLLLLTSLTLFILPHHQTNQFDSWKSKFNPKFTLEQQTLRKSIFNQNLEEINHHNSLLGTKYKKSVNQFTIYTKQEFSSKFLDTLSFEATISISDEDVLKGANVDWVSYGAVSSVKDQGNCKASYAFSAVGAIESANYIWTKNAVEYSVQNIIDCSNGFGNNGCESGRMDNSFLFVRDRGLNTKNTYPYAEKQQSCVLLYGKFKIGGYKNATGCDNLQTAIVKQPISVAVDGNNFQSYRSGVFSDCGTNLSLAALLVGMTDEYWKLKLSWGRTWGEDGYMKLARGNTCGVCNQPSYPTQ